MSGQLRTSFAFHLLAKGQAQPIQALATRVVNEAERCDDEPGSASFCYEHCETQCEYTIILDRDTNTYSR
jgi:hypothetical protein